MWRKWCCAGWIFVFCAGSLTGLGAAPASTGPALNVPALVELLSHPEYAQRQAAQRRLELAPFDQFERIKGLAQSAGDPLVKDRLERVVDALEERMALEPPPISLHLKDASADEAHEALRKAVGTDMISIEIFDPLQEPSYTIDADNKPLWEIIEALSRQHPPARYHNPARHGAFIFFATSARIGRWVDLRNPKRTEPYTYTMQIIGRYDPRVPVFGAPSMHISRVVDQDDRVLFQGTESSAAQHSTEFGFPNAVIQFTVPPGPAARIASLRGEATFRVGVGKEQVEFPVEFGIPVTRQIGNSKATIVYRHTPRQSAGLRCHGQGGH